MKKNLGSILLFCALLIIPRPPGSTDPQTAQPPLMPRFQDGVRQALLLSSYHVNMPWARDIMNGVESVLDLDHARVELSIEHMDTKRIYDEVYAEQLFRLYQYKFQAATFDIIITADDDALSFLLKYRDDLFPGVPVVFCGVNRLPEHPLEGEWGITGVVETTEHLKTLNLTLTLQPDAKTIYIINDRTTTGLILRQQVEASLDALIRPVEIVFLDDLTIEDLQITLDSLSPNTIVYLMTFHRDAAGRAFTSQEIMQRVSDASQAPIYATGKEYLGFGIVGGYLNWGFTQGETAAALALRILNGEDPASIPVITQSPNPPMFDYIQLKRWKIPLNRLPDDAILINQDESPSFFEKYRSLVLGMAGIFSLLVIIIGVLTTSIVRRQQAERALRLSEGRYRTLFDNASDGIFSVDLSGRLIAVNTLGCERLGYSRDELLQMTIEQIDPLQETGLAPLIATVREQGHSIFETVHIRKDGSRLPVEVSVRFIHYDGDRVLLGFARDITERKKAQDELQRYREHLETLVKERTAKLEAANQHLVTLSRLKDEFVSNVSHELRTPITNLKLRQHLIKSQPARHEAHLGVMSREIDRLEDIIEDLLYLSRLDQGRMMFTPTQINLNDLVRQYVTDRVPLAESRGLRMGFVAAPDLPPVNADTGLWGQALSALLTNALNYTPSGGEVEVCTGVHEWDGQRWVGVSVRDTGPGIPPEERPRLFERFFRGRAGQETGTPGTGLGLAIVQEIVDIHGGRVEVTSNGQAGSGSIFSIWLPPNGT